MTNLCKVWVFIVTLSCLVFDFISFLSLLLTCSCSTFSLSFCRYKIHSHLNVSSDKQKWKDVHFLVSWQTEGAAVGQLHDVDGEALVSGLVAEAELHLRAARRQPLLVRAQEEVCRDARPAGNTNTQTHLLPRKNSNWNWRETLNVYFPRPCYSDVMTPLK